MKSLILALPLASLVWQVDLRSSVCPQPPAPRVIRVPGPALAALPAKTRGRFGREGDPLNLLFLGSESAVRETLSHAGWTEIPRTILGSVLAGLCDLLSGRRLSRFPPMNGYRVLERLQDMNWAITLVPIEKRHHFRLWRTGLIDARGRELWWGSGNFDLSARYWDLSHRPDPDMNAERDFIAESLKGSRRVEKISLIPLPQIPRNGHNDKGYAHFTDGRALLVELK